MSLYFWIAPLLSNELSFDLWSEQVKPFEIHRMFA